jgi:tetratricopeptide (TPR) repeat protein
VCADDEVDQQTANVVAGAAGLPSSAAQSFVGQHRLRQTTDPRAGAFLKKLAHVAKSRILITTRLYPSELQLPTGYPRPGWKKIETLGDLTPAIERYHTLVGLGRYDDACALFRDRLEEATLFRLAAHRERIAWLERLFPDGAAGLPAVTTGGDQSYALNVLAQSYRFSGQPGRSAPLFRRAGEIDESRGDARSLRVVLTNLGDALREIGALREAVGAVRRALVLNRELEDNFNESVSLRYLGYVLCATTDHVVGHARLAGAGVFSWN